MKLHARAEQLSAEERTANLFEPWERLLIVSLHLIDDDPPELRELAAACFACIKHMAGKLTREDAYRAVARALDTVKDRPRAAPCLRAVSPPAAEPVQVCLPVDEGTTIRVTPATMETLLAYARERKFADVETAIERLVRTAKRRRKAVNDYNAKAAKKRARKRPATRGPCAACGKPVGADDLCRRKACPLGKPNTKAAKP